MKQTWSRAAGLMAAAVLLAACSGESAALQTTAPGGTTVTVTSTSTAPAATSSAPSPTASATTSSGEPPSSLPPAVETSTSQPWPADFTPEQAAAAQAAIDAYRNALRVTDEAYADPGRADLEAFIDQSVADPYSDKLIQGAQGLAEKGQRTTGTTVAEVKATAIESNRVSLDICLDSSGRDLLNAEGVSVRVDLPVGPRIKQTANVYDYGANGGWLLSELTTAQPYEPC